MMMGMRKKMRMRDERMRGCGMMMETGKLSLSARS
jgi:hypothetical protein